MRVQGAGTQIGSSAAGGAAAEQPTLATPKRAPRPLEPFPYYAGFSEEFVEDLLERYRPRRVLDPWNGSGTTTSVAARSGIRSVGYDLNPFMNVVAVARNATRAEWLQVLKRLPSSWSPVSRDNDLLETWMLPDAAAIVRGLLLAWGSRLGIEDTNAILGGCTDGRVAAAALVLSRVVRDAVEPFGTSNPTWIRLRVPKGDRINLASREVYEQCRAYGEQLAEAAPRREPRRAPRVITGDARTITDRRARFELVVTSPPYCTRIDYVVATLPELATLGFSTHAVKELRASMLGTPAGVGAPPRSALRGLPSTAKRLLKQVASHPSKAAPGYYHNFYASYLLGLQRSIGCFGRLLAPSGRAVLVVQNSFFREHLVDLGKIVPELASQVGLSEAERWEYRVPNPYSINPASAKYRKNSATVEVVIELRN